MLEVREIAFAYDRSRARWVLEDISVGVARGEVLAVVGPNGSGKTTLLRLMRGMMRPQHGEVRLDGESLHRFSARELARRIGYVAQTPPIAFRLTALEYVVQARFPYSRRIGFESPEDLEIAHEALRWACAAEFATRWMSELSGGERQRILLARALALQPRVLLLDEPTTHLDPRFQVEMLGRLRRLTRERALMTVFVAHDLDLVAAFADRVLLLKSGRALALGSPEEVLTAENLCAAFETSFLVDRDPTSGRPRVRLAAGTAGDHLGDSFENLRGSLRSHHGRRP